MITPRLHALYAEVRTWGHYAALVKAEGRPCGRSHISPGKTCHRAVVEVPAVSFALWRDIRELRKKAAAHMKSLIGHSETNLSTGDTIKIDRAGAYKAVSRQHSETDLLALQAMPSLLRVAQRTALNIPDRSGRREILGFHHYIRAIHRLGVSLVRGKSIFELKITVKETTSGNHYYTHQIASENAKG